MNLTERFIENAVVMMSVKLDKDTLYFLRNCLVSLFSDYDLVPHKELPSTEIVDNSYVINHFLATKKMCGLSNNTIHAYAYRLKKFFETCNKNVQDINTNDIRKYLSFVGINNTNSYVDDARRTLNTFFVFCENEEYILKNPCTRVEKIKKKTTVRIPFSETEIELLREACTTKREICLVDFLLSTGCRRDEVSNVKISNINFSERSVLVQGKGNKERVVFLSARTVLHIQDYLSHRDGDSEYLFCSDRFPYNKMANSGLECIIKRIGKRSKVKNVHLHRFRRTFATYMVNRGVPIQDLKEMLGHTNLDTTNIYVTQNIERIKNTYKNNCM